MAEALIRAARQGDLPALLALYPHLQPDDPAPQPARVAAAWAALLGSGLTTVLVAEVAGTIVSSCTLAIIPNLTRGARPYAVIENVVTHPAHRGQGLARAVLLAAQEAAWAVDCYKVMLASGSQREATLRFYEAAGFTRGGKTFFQVRRE